MTQATNPEVDYSTSPHYATAMAWYAVTGDANTEAKAAQVKRGAVQQEQAQFFAALPSADDIAATLAGCKAAHDAAIANGTKKAKATNPLHSNIAYLAKGLKPEAEGDARYGGISFKRDEKTGDILAFGNGGISAEYNALKLLHRTPAQKWADADALVAELQEALDNAITAAAAAKAAAIAS